jgi:RNA polymerase sigma factor (TIGR02999 family)
MQQPADGLDESQHPGFQWLMFELNGILTGRGYSRAVDKPIDEGSCSEPQSVPVPIENDLFAQVYAQLHQIATSRLRNQNAGYSLQATALVNEAFLKLRGSPQLQISDRNHFYRLAAEAMRQILVDHARSKARQKRGGLHRRTMSDVAQLAAEQDSDEIMALEEAIQRFEVIEPRAAEVVKLRFFAGLSVEETAEVTGLSVRTVNREWKFARAWLFNALE